MATASMTSRRPHADRKGIVILGSTGSIGVSTLDVLARHPDKFHVVALTAHHNVDRLLEQCRAVRPQFAVVGDPARGKVLTDALRAEKITTEVLVGEDALCQVAQCSEADYVMAAIVGAAGLSPTLAAARAGKRVLLANKEALVMSGPLFMQTVVRGGGQLIPIDSEHNAIFQCLPHGDLQHTCAGTAVAGVRKILLTASGGPFLRSTAESLHDVTPDQACAHPKWSMGRKISVDSATLMNKGLELIEACLLFGLPPQQVEVVVHPQSVVHSMVEYLDGSVLAQLGNPDMRTPIAHALGCPDRLVSGVESLDIVRIGRLDFEAPDLDRFPALRLARQAAEAGGTAPASLNAANEIAVAAFLAGRLRFPNIATLIERVMQAHQVADANTLDAVLAADSWARSQAQAVVNAFDRQ